MITRSQIRRQLRKGGIASLPRQGYFLGDIVGGIGDVLGGAAKKAKEIVKSDAGKAALAIAAMYATRNMGPIGKAGGWKNFLLGAPGMGAPTPTGATPGLLGKWGLTKGGGSLMPTVLGGIAGGTALMAGMAPKPPKDQLDLMKQRGEDLEPYLRDWYKKYYTANWQEGWTQEGEDEFVRVNTSEYNKGGRVGYGLGNLVSEVWGKETGVVHPNPDKVATGNGFMGSLIPRALDSGILSIPQSPENKLQQAYAVYVASGGDLEYEEWKADRMMAAQGGRIGYDNGGYMDDIYDLYLQYLTRRKNQGSQYSPSRSEYERYISDPIPMGQAIPEGGFDEIRRQRAERGPGKFAVPSRSQYESYVNSPIMRYGGGIWDRSNEEIRMERARRGPGKSTEIRRVGAAGLMIPLNRPVRPGDPLGSYHQKELATPTSSRPTSYRVVSQKGGRIGYALGPVLPEDIPELGEDINLQQLIQEEGIPVGEQVKGPLLPELEEEDIMEFMQDQGIQTKELEAGAADIKVTGDVTPNVEKFIEEKWIERGGQWGDLIPKWFRDEIIKYYNLKASAPHPDENWMGLWEDLRGKGEVPESIRNLQEFKNWFQNQDFDIDMSQVDTGIMQASKGGRAGMQKGGRGLLSLSHLPWLKLLEEEEEEKAKGGRVGLQGGTPAIDPRMQNTLEENVRMNNLQKELNERVKKGSKLQGLELRNRFIPGASGEIPEPNINAYGIKPQAYNLNNPSHTPNEAQIYASYRNQGLSPERIKAMAYADTRQSTYGDIAPLRSIHFSSIPMAGDPYNPLSMEKFFTTPQEHFANYQEELRRTMLQNPGDPFGIRWDPEATYDWGGGYTSPKGIYTFAPDEEILAAQPKSWQEAVHGDTWEGLSDRDQHQLAKRFPGTTPTLRDPDWTYDPNWANAAQGGRIGKFGGGLGGLPGIPRMAADGLEYDMRGGGFQNLGAKEGKDDVKANLAKNEFVMTADAVRGAGGGDIEVGAQRMYDTMKKLERKIA